MLIIPHNVGPPFTITVVFQAPILGPDLTTVSAIVFNVLRRDGTTTAWTPAIVSSTERELVAQYTFTGGGEITSTGAYYVSPLLSVPGGALPSETVTLLVTSEFAAQPITETNAWIASTTTLAGPGPSRLAVWAVASFVATWSFPIGGPAVVFTVTDQTAGSLNASLLSFDPNFGYRTIYRLSRPIATDRRIPIAGYSPGDISSALQLAVGGGPTTPVPPLIFDPNDPTDSNDFTIIFPNTGVNPAPGSPDVVVFSHNFIYFLT